MVMTGFDGGGSGEEEKVGIMRVLTKMVKCGGGWGLVRGGLVGWLAVVGDRGWGSYGKGVRASFLKLLEGVLVELRKEEEGGGEESGEESEEEEEGGGVGVGGRVLTFEIAQLERILWERSAEEEGEEPLEEEEDEEEEGEGRKRQRVN